MLLFGLAKRRHQLINYTSGHASGFLQSATILRFSEVCSSPVQSHRKLHDRVFFKIRAFQPLSASPRFRLVLRLVAVVRQRVRALLHVKTRRSRFVDLQLATVRPPARSAALPALAEALADDPLESEPEVFREQRVYERVYGAVAVAEPEEDGKHHGVDAVDAERAD